MRSPNPSQFISATAKADSAVCASGEIGNLRCRTARQRGCHSLAKSGRSRSLCEHFLLSGIHDQRRAYSQLLMVTAVVPTMMPMMVMVESSAAKVKAWPPAVITITGARFVADPAPAIAGPPLPTHQMHRLDQVGSNRCGQSAICWHGIGASAEQCCAGKRCNRCCCQN